MSALLEIRLGSCVSGHVDIGDYQPVKVDWLESMSHQERGAALKVLSAQAAKRFTRGYAASKLSHLCIMLALAIAMQCKLEGALVDDCPDDKNVIYLSLDDLEAWCQLIWLRHPQSVCLPKSVHATKAELVASYHRDLTKKGRS